MAAGYGVVSEREDARVLIERYKRLGCLAPTRARALRDVERALKALSRDLGGVKALLARRYNKGRPLVGLGLICIALPEPVFSNVVGATLIALGHALQRSSSSVEDLVEALREAKSFLEHEFVR